MSGAWGSVGGTLRPRVEERGASGRPRPTGGGETIAGRALRGGYRVRRRKRLVGAVVRLIGVAAFLLVLLLILGLDTAPPPGAGVAEGAAMVAAGQEFDRVVEATGDRAGAEQAAERVYWEVLDRWEP